MAEKKCSKCGEIKPHEQFRVAKHHRDGLTSQCAECVNAGIRLWYQKNKSARKKTQAAWHEKNKARRNAQALAAYYADKDTWRMRTKEWAEKNPERWREMMRVSDSKRRALKAGAIGTFTEKDVRAIFALQRGRCAVCKRELDKSFHRDHIIALASGGTNDKLNLQLLCKSCNSRKHKKDPIKFMQENGYLL